LPQRDGKRPVNEYDEQSLRTVSLRDKPREAIESAKEKGGEGPRLSLVL
jgi:hypothetical protein